MEEIKKQQETPQPGLELRYFVLKPRGNDAHAVASRAAMREYARRIQDSDPKLALDLYDWVRHEMTAAFADDLKEPA